MTKRILFKDVLRNDDGETVPLAEVEVRDALTDALVTLYDSASGVGTITQPFDTTADGIVEFWALPGNYDLTFTFGSDSFSKNIYLDNPRKDFATRAALVTAVSDGETWADGAIVSDGTVSYVAEDGATAISDLGGLVPNGNITPEHFGWVSGISTPNATTAVAAAIAYIKAEGGGALHFGPNIYVVNGGFAIDFDGFSMVGDNPGVSEIRLPGDTTLATFAATGGTNLADGVVVQDFEITGLRFTCNSTTVDSGICLEFKGTKNVKVRECYFDGFHRVIDLYGTLEPTWIVDNYFTLSLGNTTNLGNAGGTFVRCMPLTVNSGAPQAGPEDPDTGEYYQKCVQVWISRNQMRHWPDTVSDGIVLTAIDGATINDNHILRCNGSQILIEQSYNSTYMWNIRIYDNHFDGTSPYTDECIRIAPASYATPTVTTAGLPSCMRVDIYDNNFDEGGTNQILCGNRDVAYLNIRGNLFRNSTASEWIKITRGGGEFRFTDNTLMSKNASVPDIGIALHSVAAAQFFDHTIIDGNLFTSLDGNPALDWINTTGAVNRVTITNNQYEDATGGSGGNLLWDQSSAGTVFGDEKNGNNVSITTPVRRSGTFTPTVRFATSGDASFTYTQQSGWFERFGDMAIVTVSLQFDTNAYTTASGTFLIDLPDLPFDLDSGNDARAALTAHLGNVTIPAAVRGYSGQPATADALRIRMDNDAAGPDLADETNFTASTSNIILVISGVVVVA